MVDDECFTNGSMHSDRHFGASSAAIKHERWGATESTAELPQWTPMVQLIQHASQTTHLEGYAFCTHFWKLFYSFYQSYVYLNIWLFIQLQKYLFCA